MKKYIIVSSLSLVTTLATLPIQNNLFNAQPLKYFLLGIVTFIWVFALFRSFINIYLDESKNGSNIDSKFSIDFLIYIILLSITLSGFWLLVFYPGILDKDSFSQWFLALDNQIYDWFPPTMALLMSKIQLFFDKPTIMNFIQGILFWSSIIYIARQLFSDNRFFLGSTTFLVFLPPIWLYSHALTSNAWMASFMLYGIAFLVQSVDRQNRLYFLLSSLMVALALLFRRDAIIFLPVLIFVYIVYFKAARRKLYHRIYDILLMVFIVVIPNQLVAMNPAIISGYNPSGHGLLNRYVGIAHNSLGSMSLPGINQEREIIDRVLGAGAFDKMIDRYDCVYSNYLVWPLSSNPILQIIPKSSNKFIASRILSLSIKHPMSLIKHQLCFFQDFAQVSKIHYQTWGSREGRKEDPYIVQSQIQSNMIPNSKLPYIKSLYSKTMIFWFRGYRSLVFRHYIFIFALLFSFIFSLFYKNFKLLFLSLYGLSYFFLLWLFSPAPLWRYLLSTYLCSWLCLLVLLEMTFRSFRKRFPLKSSQIC